MITSDLFTNNSPALFENTGPVTHRIGLTVTDPNHPMVSKRKEPYQKSIRITQNVPDREAAINQAIAHYRRKGYKVHDHHYLGTVDQGVAEGLSEMDKSQTPPGRDGSNDEGGKKEYPAKIITPKKAVKDGVKILNKVLNKKQGMAEDANLNYIWIQGDFDGDTASSGATQGSWRDQQSTPVKLTRGRMTNVRPLSGPPPEGGKTIKQAQIPLTLDAGEQKFSTTGVDLQLTVAPNGYVTNGEVGRVRGTAVVKIMRPESVEEDLTRRGFLRGLGAAALAGAAGGALAGSNDPNFVRKVHDQHNAMIEKNPRYAKEHDALGIYLARGIAGASAENNKRWVEKTAKLLQKYGVNVNEGMAEDDDAVAAFLARGGEVQRLKPAKPRKGERWQGSSHIGAAGGRGTKGRVSGLAANTGKSGKPVVTAEQGVAEGSEEDAYGNTGEKHECGSCDGTGIVGHDELAKAVEYDDVCPECGGKGWVRDKESLKKKGVAEVSLGDYPKKAQLSQVMAQTNRFFDRDDPAKVAAADQTIAKREKGLARADARRKPYTAPPVDKEKQRQQLTDKYPNIDELVRRAELNRDPNYEYADGQAYYDGQEAEQLYQRLKQIQSIIKGQQLDEISLDQIGTGIANVIGGVSKAAGAVAGVPQGIGRAVKKGYRGSVQGIGGADNSETDVPGAAYGDTNRGKEVPTGAGTINPATNRPYVPSDFAATDEPTTATDAGDTQRTVDKVRQDIQSLDTAYKNRLKALQNELSGLQKGSASDQELSQAQQDYISAIGPDQPSGGRASAATDNATPTAPAAAPSMARDPKVLNTLQNLDAKELRIIKKILQARARATNESELYERNAFIDATGEGERFRRAASNTVSGIRSAASSAANMAKSAYKAAKPYVKKAGQIAAAVPGAVATGAGAVAGGVAGMKNAARKGYAAGQKHVGGGALTMDELQQAIGGMTADDAKQLLMFVKQLEIQNAPAKGKAKPKARKPSATTLPSNTTPTTTTPTWTGRQTATEPTAVAESLTWSKKFDPGMTLYKRMKSGR